MLQIYISSYRRPLLLKQCLESLNATIFNAPFEIGLYVGLVNAQPEDVEAVKDFRPSKHIDEYILVKHPDNIGKARVINDFYAKYGSDADYLLVIDQDMVFYKPIIPHIMAAMTLKVDVVGFAGINYWHHRPHYMELDYGYTTEGYRIYYPVAISGAMMLVDGEFQKNYEWTNYHGVFGGEDVDISLATERKAALYHHSLWARHDPNGAELYPDYYNKKAKYDLETMMVLEEGWDA
jgi:hypothetical protein